MMISKPKFWDYKKPNYLSYLLLPFTFPVILNNYLLNLKKHKRNKGIKTICLGNIYIGGTAKTPLTIKIAQIVKNLNFKTATIKKFYANQIDEQTLLASKTSLYCHKDRATALNSALKDKVDIAIFDDGLQDRSLKYDLSFVCFNNINWIGNGFLIPSGPLREKVQSILKYDAIFLNGNEEDNSYIIDSIKEINSDIKIFETYYIPTNINKFNIEDNYLMFAGIGNPESFKRTLLKHKLKIIKEINFPDHYQYSKKDIEKIKSIALDLDAKIITTEKDFVKIPSKDSNKINFLAIDIFIKKQSELISFIQSKL